MHGSSEKRCNMKDNDAIGRAEKVENSIVTRDTHQFQSVTKLLSSICQTSVPMEIISYTMWMKMRHAVRPMEIRLLQRSKYTHDESIHRFTDIKPYGYNTMLGRIGSWMGDGCGMMQWPMPGSRYQSILRSVVSGNQVGLIIALGRQEKNQGMINYWETLGTTHKEIKMDDMNDLIAKSCKMYVSKGIPGYNRKKSELFVIRFIDWPDFGNPAQTSLPIFDFLFQKIWECQKKKRRYIIHCRAGVGRSGMLLLMYKAWKGEITHNNLLAKFTELRSLRANTVQRASQFTFVLYYVNKIHGSFLYDSPNGHAIVLRKSMDLEDTTEQYLESGAIIEGVTIKNEWIRLDNIKYVPIFSKTGERLFYHSKKHISKTKHKERCWLLIIPLIVLIIATIVAIMNWKPLVAIIAVLMNE